jgi:thiamine-phosphate diphosphorylase
VERERQGADFVLFGPVYPSPSKPGYRPAAGTAGLAKVARGLSIPVFALGGISPERVPECLDAGAYGVAVMSGLMQADRPAACARAYLEELGRACSRS